MKGKDVLMARLFMAVPFSKLAMYLVLAQITFSTDYDSEDPSPMYNSENSKESLKKMTNLVVTLVSREEKTLLTASPDWYGRGKVRSAYQLHEVLNRLGKKLVLDTNDLDSFIDGCEYTGNQSQSEERTYFRCLLLLTPKCFESEMLTAIGCRKTSGVTDAVNNRWSDSDTAADEDSETESV
eukprot:gene3241-2387_t